MPEYSVTTTTHKENDLRSFTSLFAAHSYAESLVSEGFEPLIEAYSDGSTRVLTWTQLNDLVCGGNL